MITGENADKYTPDAICQALGLTALIEPECAESNSLVMRLLLKPSFHPEICITISRGLEVTDLTVLAASSQFWPLVRDGRMSVSLNTYQETERLGLPILDEFVPDFLSVFEKVSAIERWVYVDGMGVNAVLSSGQRIVQFGAHASIPALSRFISRVISVSWRSCKAPHVRNGLADAARYVGTNYAKEVIPQAPTKTRLLILGTPDDRTELLELLRRRDTPQR